MAIRNSWLKEKNDSIRHWFVVGSRSCPIPLEFRRDQYSCTEINYNITELQNNSNFRTHQVLNFSTISRIPAVRAFGFKVHHPIVVHKLGLVDSALLRDPNVTFTVSLLNDFTKEVMAKTQLGGVVTSGTTLGGFRYRPVEGMLTLSKDFEGVILVEPQLPDNIISVNTSWNSGGEGISFTKMMSGNLGWQHGQNPADAGSLISMDFSIQDAPTLQAHISRRSLTFIHWARITQQVQLDLEKEMAEHQDVKMIEGVDVYRRLPQKLLSFLSWFESQDVQYQFLLKTDDDVALNLRTIQEELSALSTEDMVIWSRFRRWWQVNDCSKWADLDYVSLTYPPFPCGGGYVLSKPLVSWLAANSPNLHPYQGEDVSMGIWLAALHPHMVEDERWSCDDSCISTSYNRPQLSPSQIEQAWETFRECGSLCQCGQVT